MRIAVCDDSKDELENIRRIFIRLKSKYAFDADFFSNSENIIKSLEKTKYDLFLLDIEMPDMNGISLAEKIRERDTTALIVFLTGYARYMKNVFGVVTFDYIMKPVTDDILQKILLKAFKYLTCTNQSFSFNFCRNQYSLKYEEIIYFEKSGRHAIIHTQNENYITNMTLENIWKQLDVKSFATIHGSFIVNIKYVKMIETDSLMTVNGEKLRISRGYKKQFIDKYVDFFKGGM